MFLPGRRTSSHAQRLLQRGRAGEKKSSFPPAFRTRLEGFDRITRGRFTSVSYSYGLNQQLREAATHYGALPDLTYCFYYCSYTPRRRTTLIDPLQFWGRRNFATATKRRYC